MNICLIIGTLGGGGAEKVVLQLATTLSKLGHRVDIIIFDNVIDYSIDYSSFNVHVLDKPYPAPHALCITWRRMEKDRRVANALRAKIAELNIPIDLCVSNLPAVDRICKTAKLPNLYFLIHGILFRDKRYKIQKNTGLKWLIRNIKYPYFARRQYKNANLVAVSKGVENDLLALGIKPKSIQTIYNPFDADSIRAESEAYSVTEDEYIVHVGRFHRHKRHDILVKAYKQAGIEQKLLLLGDCATPEGEHTRQLVRDLGLDDKVIFVGFKSNPYPYIKNAKALVLSSDCEGFGMVLVEALILGVPVVSTDCPAGPREILTGELSRFLSPAGYVEALSENIREVIARPPQISEHHAEKFDAVVGAKKYLALCE